MSQIIPFIIFPIGVFWLWMYRDMTKNVYLTDKEKDNWTLYFFFLIVFAEYRQRH